MVQFILGMLVGGFFGVVLMCVVSAGKHDNDNDHLIY